MTEKQKDRDGTEERPRPWAADGDPSISFGTWLRRQREVREITLRQISESTKVSMRYLEALEDDRFELLPAPLFARGFLREYAKVVGLDPDEVVNYFMSAHPSSESAEAGRKDVLIQKPNRAAKRAKKPAEKRSGLGILVAILTVLLAIVLGFASWERRERGALEQAPGMAPPPSATVESGAGVRESEDPLQVTLDFNENSWVDAFVDGERMLSELRVQGESLRLEAKGSVRLSLGNVRGVAIELNGMPFEPSVQDREEFEVTLATVKDLEDAS